MRLIDSMTFSFINYVGISHVLILILFLYYSVSVSRVRSIHIRACVCACVCVNNMVLSALCFLSFSFGRFFKKNFG